MSLRKVAVVTLGAKLLCLQFCTQFPILACMRRLAVFAHDHRRLIIGLWIAAVLAAGGLAAGAAGTFVNNFNLPGTESQRAADLLKDRFPQQAGDSSQIVFRSDAGTLRSAERRAQVQRVVKSVEHLPSVSAVTGPYEGG